MKAVVYVGPTFKDSRLNQFMVFSDGVPEPEGQDPIYMHLFVPLEKLNQAMVDLETKGSQLHTFYQLAVEANKEKVKEVK